MLETQTRIATTCAEIMTRIDQDGMIAKVTEDYIKFIFKRMFREYARKMNEIRTMLLSEQRRICVFRLLAESRWSRRYETALYSR